MALSSRLSIGYNDKQWTERAGFSDANLGLRASWRLMHGRVTVSPFVNHSHSLDHAMVPTHTYGGVELALSTVQ